MQKSQCLVAQAFKPKWTVIMRTGTRRRGTPPYHATIIFGTIFEISDSTHDRPSPAAPSGSSHWLWSDFPAQASRLPQRLQGVAENHSQGPNGVVLQRLEELLGALQLHS